jgi:zinc/manganese transport system ATP-binding protein
VTPAPLALHSVTVAHGRHAAVQDLSGSFAPGSMTAVVGPNGAGKTTLLRALAGLHPPARGRILGAQHAALLPQRLSLDRAFPLTCLEAVALGAARAAGPFRRIDPAPARAALDRVGLPGFAARPIAALSAGQFQRVLFARLIVEDAPVLLLDEPFNAVDARTETDLLAILEDWRGQGRTIVAVLHDLDLVRAAFPRTLLLARRPIAWGPSHEVLRPERLREARLLAERWRDDPPIGRAA